MFKRIALATLFVVAFSVCAFAGEGSDTIGACKLMPELRYSYYEIPMVTDDWSFTAQEEPFDVDWAAKEHSAVVNLTWGAFDNLDLYTFVGARICTDIEAISEGDVDVGVGLGDFRAEFDLGTGFTCGLGIRGTFWRSPGGFYVGAGASVVYAVTNGKRHYREYTDDILVTDSLDDFGFYYQEQNLAAVADFHVGWSFKNIGLTPYLGVEYRWNRAYVRGKSLAGPEPSPDEITFREKEPVGVYVGVDYLIGKRLNLNLEGHMINRWGGSFSVGYLFDICGKPEPIPPVVPEPVIEPKLEPMSFK